MARDFTPKKFYRLAGAERIEEYLEAKGLDIVLPKKTKKGEDAGELIAERLSSTLTEDQLKKAESDFRLINDLSWEPGVMEMLQAAKDDGDDLISVFDKCENDHYAKAFWCFLNRREIFDQATLWLDVLSFQSWQYFYRLPTLPPEKIEAAIPAFEASVCAYLRKRDGSGRQCKVEVYRRGDVLCAVAFPEGNGQSDHEYVGGVLKKTQRKPVKEMYFYYEPTGCLRIKANGGKPVVEKLFRAFSTICLGMKEDAEVYTNAFDIEQLKTQPELPTDPSDEIEFVRVRSIKLACVDVLGARYTIEVSRKSRRREALYDELRKFPYALSEYKVEEAIIQFKFPGGGRKGSVSAVIKKDSCNLNDSPLHIKAMEYLRKWKIANEHRLQQAE